MAKEKLIQEGCAPAQPYSFFRPHKRVQYTGELVDAFGVVTRPPSMTKQSFKDECDINNILRQYKMTGMISHISGKAAQGAYTDLPDPIDFQESLNIVHQGELAFATLPSSIRARFANNPEAFLTFCADPANTAEMIKLGLAVERQAPKQETPAVSTPQDPKLTEKPGDK